MSLIIESVAKSYGPSSEVLRDCNLTIGRGEKVALLGPNGAGKTTLLKLMCGLIKPSKGRVSLNGCPARLERNRIAYSSDDEDVYAWMNARDVERLMSGLFLDFKVTKFRELYHMLQIPLQRFSTLSKGEKRRFKLALTLARRAEFYLLDEPLSGIDIVSREQILKAIMYDWSEESTLILSTHEFEGVHGIFTRALFLKNGKLAGDEKVSDIESRGKTIVERYKEVFQ